MRSGGALACAALIACLGACESASPASARDASADTSPVDASPVIPGVAERAVAPSPNALADIVGLSINDGECPAGMDAASTARRRQCFRKIHELGATRIRREFFWDQIEPSQGAFVWARYDQYVADATASGLTTLGLLCYGNPWAAGRTDGDRYFPPADPATFAAFARATAQHFHASVHDWEVWNEPNAGFRFWRSSPRGDARAFGRLTELTAAAIRDVDPSARVAFGGTVFLPQLIPGALDFVADAFAANPSLAPRLNAFAMHAYGFYPPVNPPESDVGPEVPLDRKVRQLTAVLDDAQVDRARPMWLTEIGWPVYDRVTEAVQARWTVRAILVGAWAGLDQIYLYNLYDGPMPDSVPPEQAFGLIHHDADATDAVEPADKASFLAVKALLARVGRAHVTRRIPIDGAPEAWVLELNDGAHTAWAAWQTESARGATTWRPPGPASRCFDTMGQALPASDARTLGVDPVICTD